MRRIRFLADHDLNEHIIIGVLRCKPAIEFRHVGELGLANQPDADILQYAEEHGFIVVSHDVNTMPAEAYARLAVGKKIAELLMIQRSSPIGCSYR